MATHPTNQNHKQSRTGSQSPGKEDTFLAYATMMNALDASSLGSKVKGAMLRKKL